MSEKEIRLTAYSACAGCAAKIAPGDLRDLLAILNPGDSSAHTNLLVGLGKPDDAAVYRITSDLAIVETVDFFPPIVDDPYTWGAVAAANAMSDIYAMGGEVLFALAVAGFPREMPSSVVAEVFRGAAEKVAEAGGVITGGHTVVDPEPKYGLCVTGRVHPDRIMVKGGLRPGDRLFVSKPLGTGIITTAAKAQAAPADVLASAVASMMRLNRHAAEVARGVGAIAVTDVTGFGLLGHAAEMVQGSAAGVALDASRLPLLMGAQELAEKGHFSGGMMRNRRHVEVVFGPSLRIYPKVPEPLVALLFESETSGGLLFSVTAHRAHEVAPLFACHGAQCWEIGTVVATPTITVAP